MSRTANLTKTRAVLTIEEVMQGFPIKRPERIGAGRISVAVAAFPFAL
jgi:hypothetical protein